MDHDIRQSRIASLKRYLEDEYTRTHESGDDARLHSLFLSWYAEPYMAESRNRTVAVAKRMLAELGKELQDDEHLPDLWKQEG